MDNHAVKIQNNVIKHKSWYNFKKRSEKQSEFLLHNYPYLKLLSIWLEIILISKVVSTLTYTAK